MGTTNGTAEQRMDKFDRQLQATRKLVEAGMKYLVRLTARIDDLTGRIDDLTARMDDLVKTQKAFLRALQNGHNGNGSRGHKGRG